MEKLYNLSLREAAKRMREGTLSAAELTRACLTRCSRLEPRIDAWEHLAAEQAIERAEALDQARARGTARPPLHGIPLGIKDIIHVAGMPTTMGSPICEGRVADETAPVVERLISAGAVILGKTVTTEFAFYTPRKTHNPWNPAHTPGGSSMGSAAAVAAGMACAALGTQTNGSVIRPAAFCGVVGFKPGHDAIDTRGMLAFAPTLDTVGIFARSSADIAALAATIAGPDSRVTAEITSLPHPPRLAAVRSPVWNAADAVQQKMLASNVAALRHAGADVDEAELPGLFAQAHDTQRCIMAYEGAMNLGSVQRQHRDRISARLNEFLDEGAAIAEGRYLEALALRARLQQQFARFMENFDAVITPPATGEAPGTLAETGNPAFCSIWTLLGVPAVTIPVGLGPRGLPLGMQIVAGADSEDAALAVADYCESVLPFAGWPSLSELR
jgi:Asp-tRNA(Asn)/Glu-tRNA(Gln) amidotransferase A subunit family amidase